MEFEKGRMEKGKNVPENLPFAYVHGKDRETREGKERENKTEKNKMREAKRSNPSKQYSKVLYHWEVRRGKTGKYGK